MATKFKNVPFGTEVPTITAKPDGSGNILDLQGFDICGFQEVCGSANFHCGLRVSGGSGISVRGGGDISVSGGGGISVSGSTRGNAILVSGGGDIVVQDGGAFRACGTTYIGLAGSSYGTVVLDNTFQVGCGSVFSVTPTEASFSSCAKVTMFCASMYRMEVSSDATLCACGGILTLGAGTSISTSGGSCSLASGSRIVMDCGSTFNVDCGSTFNVGCGSTFCGDLTGTITFGCGFPSSVGAHSVDFYYPPTFHCGSSLFCCGVIGFSADTTNRSSDSFLAVYSDGSSVSGQGFADPSSALVAFSMSSSDGLVIENRYNGIQLKSSCGSLSITVGSTTLELTEDALKTLKTKIEA